MVEELATTHGVTEVHLPAVIGVHVGHRGRNATLGHDRVRLAEQRLTEDGDGLAGLASSDGGAQTGAAGADNHDVEGVTLHIGHVNRPRRDRSW